MLLKASTTVTLLLLTASFVSTAKFPGFCRDCEEEVWEEVPCNGLSSTSTSTSTSTTTAAPPITLASTTITPPPPVITTTAPPIFPPIVVQPSLLPPLPPAPIAAAFKKCYCECKAGCREFCRKTLVTPDVKKTITQVSKTAQLIPDGLLEIQHLHQRNYVPAPETVAPIPYAAPAPVPVPAPAIPVPVAPVIPAPAPVPVPYAAPVPYSAPVPYASPVPIPPPVPKPYKSKPYIEPLSPLSAPDCGTIYPVESSAEIDSICGGNSPSYNSDYSAYNTIDELTQLLKSSRYNNPSSVFYSPAPSAPLSPAAPNSYSSNPPNSYQSYPQTNGPAAPNSYPSYQPPPPPPPPSPPKYPPKSYKRNPAYGSVPESNSGGPTATAAATASIKNPSASSKSSDDIDESLGNYYKDYLISNSATGSEYPAYQLSYPISY